MQQLCYGSLREYPRLIALLGKLLKSPLKRKDQDLQALLVVGLHQLLDMRTPDHAAISATVDGCRGLGKPWATRLVNGVLRNAARQRDSLESDLSEPERLRHPQWLLAAIQEAWPEHWQQIVEANNAQAPMCLRVNTLRQSRDDYLARLDNDGLSAEACALASDGIRLNEAVDVTLLPEFREGSVSVQDEAAQLAADLFTLETGGRVLDACAAPGGKSCHLLERYPEIAELVAMDHAEERLLPLRQNLERLQLTATVLCADAREISDTLGEFDAILVDAPCSGSGVIRRHPDIKVLRRASDIAGYAALQLEILNGLWPRLRDGGTLVYVTCSILPEENALCVATFLEQHGNAAADDLSSLGWGEPAGVGRQLLPVVDGHDGLFFARIQKRA